MSSITPELIGLETVSVVATSSTDELRKAAWLGLGVGVGACSAWLGVGVGVGVGVGYAEGQG